MMVQMCPKFHFYFKARSNLLAVLFLLISCIQSSTEVLIPVRYTILVRNGNTGVAIQGASVELTDENLVVRTLTTNNNGRVQFPSLESYTNQVIVSANGFIPTDTVDVISVTDSTATVILRTLNLVLYPEGNKVDSASTYSYIVTVLKTTDSQPISGAMVSVVSGSSPMRTSTTNSQGLAHLDSLPSRQNFVSVSATGYVTADTLDVVPVDSFNNNITLRSIRITMAPTTTVSQ